ncbi:hypothetical protein [Sphingomonas cynarae]|uniref:hypothetical protein n=1 Tax=Sphingomonas cynarae TaxID=930197 RepID=UPI0031CFF3CE
MGADRKIGALFVAGQSVSHRRCGELDQRSSRKLVSMTSTQPECDHARLRALLLDAIVEADRCDDNIVAAHIETALAVLGEHGPDQSSDR